VSKNPYRHFGTQVTNNDKIISTKKQFYALFYSHFMLFLQPSKRDVAQLVEYTSGGRVVAGSSPVIPTKDKANQHSGVDWLFL